MANGAWEGLAQATGRLPGLALNIAQLQQQGQHMRALEADSARRLALEDRRVQIAEQSAKDESDLRAISRQKEQIALDQAKAVEAEANRPIYRDSLPVMFPGMMENPNSSKVLLSELPWKKDPSGQEYITNRDREFFKNRLKSDVELAYRMNESQVADIGEKRANAMQQYATLLQTPPKNPEKTQEWEDQKKQIQAMVSNLDLQYKNAVENLNNLDPEVRKAQAKPAQQDTVPYMTPDGKTVLINERDPNSQKIIDDQKLVPSSVYQTGNKSKSDEQLVRGSLREKLGREPTDTEVRTQMQSDKLEAARAGAAILAGEKAKDIDIPTLAQSIIDGQDAPMAIKGSMGNPVATKVKSEILKTYPKFNMTMADANYKWKQSATNQRTVNFAGGALPRLRALDDQLKALPNVNINSINAVMRAFLTETGSPVYADFESNRNAIVQEINTALSGTSQSSDTRLNIELENLKSKRSPAQIAAAVKNLREALIARLDIDLSDLYPMEVVRGEKTMGQYKSELFSKYRGTSGREALVLNKMGLGEYAPAPNGKAVPADDMAQFWKK